MEAFPKQSLQFSDTTFLTKRYQLQDTPAAYTASGGRIHVHILDENCCLPGGD